jgi:hypothetical protein
MPPHSVTSRWARLLLLLVVVCDYSCCGSTNPQLRFFSVWEASLNGSEPNTVAGNLELQVSGRG